MTPTDLGQARLSDLSPYVYGTTRLGDSTLPLPERVAMARTVMESGVWMHTSHQYGNALEVLRQAFDQARSAVPRLIFKIGWESAEEVAKTARELTDAVGVSHIDVGQLCLNGDLASDFAAGGRCLDDFRRLRDTGLVQRFVLQVFPWTSDVAFKALSAGHTDGLIDGAIVYLNPLQRFASNDLWDLMLDKKLPIIAMRTIAGGNVIDLRDVPGAAWKEYLQVRAAQVAPIFERSGVESWPLFCVRFAHSHSTVVATVGSTAHPERFGELQRAARQPIPPLATDIVDEIHALQRQWAEQVDAFGQPGSM
jgi:hypothetical protein